MFIPNMRSIGGLFINGEDTLITVREWTGTVDITLEVGSESFAIVDDAPAISAQVIVDHLCRCINDDSRQFKDIRDFVDYVAESLEIVL